MKPQMSDQNQDRRLLVRPSGFILVFSLLVIAAASVFFWHGTPDILVRDYIRAVQKDDRDTVRRLTTFDFNNRLGVTWFDYWSINWIEKRITLSFPTDVPFVTDEVGQEIGSDGRVYDFVDVVTPLTSAQVARMQRVAHEFNGNIILNWWQQWDLHRAALEQFLDDRSVNFLLGQTCTEATREIVRVCRDDLTTRIPEDTRLGRIIATVNAPDARLLDRWLKVRPLPDETVLSGLQTEVLRALELDINRQPAARQRLLRLVADQLGDSIAFFGLSQGFESEAGDGSFRATYRFYVQRALHSWSVGGFSWKRKPRL